MFQLDLESGFGNVDEVVGSLAFAVGCTRYYRNLCDFFRWFIDAEVGSDHPQWIVPIALNRF